MFKEFLRKVIFVLLNYLFFVGVGIIFKVIFWLYNFSVLDASFAQIFPVIANGLVLDSSMAGYLTIIPLVLAMVSIVYSKGLRYILNVYYILVLTFYSALALINTTVFRYWNFPIDASIFVYLRSPKNALASGSTIEIIAGFGIFFIIAFLLSFVAIKVLTPRLGKSINKSWNIVWQEFLMILLVVPILAAIRGGLGVSIASVGNAYFSENQDLNFSAVNPFFSVVQSLARHQKMSEVYHYMDDEEMDKELARLFNPQQKNDSVQILNNSSPRVILIMMESFSANAVGTLGGYRGATPNIDKLASEGLIFTNCYATQFRTDHGLVSMLNGFPGKPSTSVMQFPAKTVHLPSLAKSLTMNGYANTLVYGGDIDFTNMRGYFYNTGYNELIFGDHYDKTLYRSKWGVRDGDLLDKALQTIRQDKYNGKDRCFYTVITLSSHEPFDVPERNFDNDYINSVFYTDECIGKFVQQLKEESLWDDTILILLADHGFHYPEDIKDYSPERFKILQLWTGGALLDKMRGERINKVVSQVDFSNSLLSALQIDSRTLDFSRNIFSDGYEPFAYYTIGSYLGCVDSTGYTAIDTNTGEPVDKDKNVVDEYKRKMRLEAYIQKIAKVFDAL